MYYILCFPYFPVPQPVEKCIQSRLIQTEYTAEIGEYKPLFGHSSVTIRLDCIQFGPPTASCLIWTASPDRRRNGHLGPAGMKAVHRRRRVSDGRCVFTCNTYSVPYKGKPRKKRLSPKSPNTLIHSCITFYKTLIFQYLSLWKSVFSRN